MKAILITLGLLLIATQLADARQKKAKSTIGRCYQEAGGTYHPLKKKFLHQKGNITQQMMVNNCIDRGSQNGRRHR